jgi:hypothetical protein
LDIYWNILTMHVLINVKSPNNISKWQMGFNSAFKGLNATTITYKLRTFRYYCSVTESKVVAVNFMSAWEGRRGRAPLIHNISCRWR